MSDSTTQMRALGRSDLRVNPVGLGCMGMSEFYGPAMDEAEAIRLLHEAVALGVAVGLMVGVLVTVNTDDPKMFDTSLADQFKNDLHTVLALHSGAIF